MGVTNRELGNKSWKEKKRIIRSKGVPQLPLTEVALKERRWTAKTIERRQEEDGRPRTTALASVITSARRRPPLLERVTHAKYHAVRIVVHLEVPHSPRPPPASRSQSFVLGPIALHVSLDLLVRVARPSTRRPFTWVSVPERTVDENGDVSASEGNVHASAGGGPVASPSAGGQPAKARGEAQVRGPVSRLRIRDIMRLRPSVGGWRGFVLG